MTKRLCPSFHSKEDQNFNDHDQNFNDHDQNFYDHDQNFNDQETVSLISQLRRSNDQVCALDF